MPKADTTIQISAPPERVWAVLMDPARLGEWVTAHRSVGEVPDELIEGSSFTQTLKLATRKFDVRWTIEEADEPRLAVWEGSGPHGSGAKVRYELDPDGTGTRFHYVNNYDLPGGPFGAAAGHAVSRPAKAAMKSSLKSLKKLVESES